MNIKTLWLLCSNYLGIYTRMTGEKVLTLSLSFIGHHGDFNIDSATIRLGLINNESFWNYI